MDLGRAVPGPSCVVCCKGGVSGTFDNEAIFRTSSILPTSFGPQLTVPVSEHWARVLTACFPLSIRQSYGGLNEKSASGFNAKFLKIFLY
jgi:hypothetical protein